MIIFGFITAVISGLGLPGHMILFGRVINNFVYYSAVTNMTGSGGSISVLATNLAMDMNTTCSELIADNPFFLTNITGNSNSNSNMLLCGMETDVFENVLDYVCDPEPRLRSTIGMFSLYYIGLATGTLLAVFISTVFWNISAYRQTRRMRQAFYRSVLHQEIGWFDVTETNELNTRLSE